MFGGTRIPDLTQSLMQQYISTGLDANVPEMFENVANCSYMWEHDGYNFRYQAMARDLMLNSISYLMSAYYIASIKEYGSEDLRVRELEYLEDCYTDYSEAALAELDRIKSRDESVRRYNPDGVTFQIAAKRIFFREWFESHRNLGFPRENQDGKSVTNCNRILSDVGISGKIAMTPDIASQVYSFYNRNNVTPVSIYTILRDSVGFRNIPDFDPGVLFVNRNEGFGHDDDDVAIPTYKIFHWESYRSHNDQDFFGIRSCLNNQARQENHNILYYCDISSYSSGTINSLGEKTRWQWFTLLKAE